MFINVYYGHEDYYYQIQNILVYIEILGYYFVLNSTYYYHKNVIIHMILIDITLMIKLIYLDEDIIILGIL